MLIGNVENLDNYKQKIVEQKNKIVETQPTNITNNQNQEIQQSFIQYRNEILNSSINKVSDINKLMDKDDKKLNKNDENNNIPKYEVRLYNQNFGYNSESKDFFIKVKRQEIELQYPTEEMMKMKIFIQEELKKITAS